MTKFLSPDTVVGQCPNCRRDTVFDATEDINIYTCGLCYKKAKQWKNGKIHWAVITDDQPYVDYL